MSEKELLILRKFNSQATRQDVCSLYKSISGLVIKDLEKISKKPNKAALKRVRDNKYWLDNYVEVVTLFNTYKVDRIADLIQVLEVKK